MTGTSLGHAKHQRHAGQMTDMIFSLVNVGAILRVFEDQTEFMVLALLLGDVYRESILWFARKNAQAGSHVALLHLTFVSMCCSVAGFCPGRRGPFISGKGPKTIDAPSGLIKAEGR
jgi:hypothetical protein